MFTVTDANALGWTIQSTAKKGSAYKGDQANPETSLQAASDTPIFTLLVNIAEREGQGFAAGYGGSSQIDAALVLAVSGETLTPTAPLTTVEQQHATEAANEQTIRASIVTRLAKIRTARTALSNGNIFASLSVNEKAVIDGLLEDDLYLGRIVLSLFDGTA